MKIKWATDIHLDHCDEANFNVFRLSCIDADALIVSGDITVAPRYEIDFERLSKCAPHVYFVCGNHCHWGGRIEHNEKRIVDVCKKFGNMTYLTSTGWLKMGDAAVVGHDGWYDARAGNPYAGMMLNDWFYVDEFVGCKDHGIDYVISASRTVADRATKKIVNDARNAINDGNKNLFIVTHVPPFTRAHVHMSRPADSGAHPWYVNKHLGDELSDLAAQHQNVNFTVLAGHTHGGTTYQHSQNLIVHVGAAQYTKPKAQSQTFDF